MVGMAEFGIGCAVQGYPLLDRVRVNDYGRGMTATLVDHYYSGGGRRFCTVECLECLQVLNSGHHYLDEHRHHAERLADEHNADRHGVTR